MRLHDRTRRAGLASFVLILIAGCGGGPSPGAAPDDQQYLQSFAEDYRMYSIMQKKPPAKLEDMKILGTNASPAMALVREGKILVEWGATLPDLKEDPGQSTAPEVLAYEKDVPTQGGDVLHLDRTVSKMTADEFKAAPKANRKK